MQASFKRKIKDGSEFDAYFPLADNAETVLIDGDETPDDTVRLMRKIVKETLSQTARFAPLVKHESTKETCKAIWNFVYNYIQYHLDSEHQEELRTPARTWQDRVKGVDCDCMSIFISSILTNLSIPHDFRVTGYKKKGLLGSEICGEYQHVYVVAYDEYGKEIIIDCVVNEFDYEVPFCRNKDMSVVKLSGFGETETDGLTDLFKDKIIAYSKSKGLDQDKALDKLRQETGENGAKIITNVVANLPQVAKAFDTKLLSDGKFETFAKNFIQGTDQTVKGIVDSIVPGGSAIIGMGDGVAKLLGFKSMRDMWFSPFYAIADLVSDAEEREPYLTGAITAHTQDMMIWLIANINSSFQEYRERQCVNLVWGKAHEKWVQQGLKSMEDQYNALKKVVEDSGFFGLLPDERNGFFQWAQNIRHRVIIDSEATFWALGLSTDGLKTPEQGFESKPESLNNLYVWAYLRKGDPYQEWGSDAWKYCGNAYKNIQTFSFGSMILSYQMRLRTPQDPVTGKQLYVREGDNVRPITQEEVDTGKAVLTPFDLQWQNIVVQKDSTGVSGLNGDDGYIPFKDYIKTDIGVKDDKQYEQALLALYDGKPALSWGKALLLILAPVAGVGLGIGLSKLKK